MYVYIFTYFRFDLCEHIPNAQMKLFSKGRIFADVDSLIIKYLLDTILQNETSSDQLCNVWHSIVRT